MDRKDTYLLNRSIASSIRLTAQHYLWLDHLGWNLHPSAITGKEHQLREPGGGNAGGDPNDESRGDLLTGTKPLAVADVACGNGIWWTQESNSSTYPSGTTFHGFDISGSQFPTPNARPANVTFSVLDASHPSRIPPEHHNAFDIVHVRLLMGSIPSPTAIHFLQAFLTLLRPGGFLQWDDDQVHNAQPFPTSETPCTWSGWVARVVKYYRPEVDMPMQWLDKLPALFEAEGMTDIQQIRGSPPKPEMRRYWTDNEFGVVKEIASSFGPDKQVFAELGEWYKKRGQEIALEVKFTIGRKALN